MSDFPNMDLPKGIQSITALPDQGLAALWKSIIVDKKMRQQLVSQGILNFSMRRKISRTILPLHGVILLVGEPGTGKTSLAKGLANEIAEIFTSDSFQLVEVEPHGLTSSGMGKTQRSVAQLFAQTVTELASSGPTIVLLDEVETLAVDRSKLSLDANPIDIHRATDAVLVQLDLLAETHKNLLFVATSNFPEAIDSAFVSRCDLVLHVPLPDAEACEKILCECLLGLADTYPEIGDLTKDTKFADCAKHFVGLDGRAIRKTVANALASSPKVALSPAELTIAQLAAAAKAAQSNKKLGGK